MSDRLGLIAGAGGLPLEIAQTVRDRGVLAIAYRGLTDPRLEEVVDELTWQTPGAIGTQLETLRSAGIGEVVLAGKIEKSSLLQAPGSLGLDQRAMDLLASLGDKRDAHLLAKLADWLEAEGLKVLSQAQTVPDLVAPRGRLGQVEPPPECMADVDRAWRLCRDLADQGIGQSVVVRDGHVIAVEAIEGTDAAIERAGRLSSGGLVVVKRTGTDHDPRFDLPAVGPTTVETLARARGVCLVVEAGATLVIDRSRMLEMADKEGIAVMGRMPVDGGRGGE